jgi:pyruvate/2-oxoglutarate dehydrogenase complex dihydrolipoamide acyltransferase (E2) component
MNATFHADEKMIRRYRSCHFNIAMDTPSGLMVPCLPEVDSLSLKALASRLSELASRAKQGQLKPADQAEGSFTVTSLGPLGGLFGIPVVNPPQVGILGVHAVQTVPVVGDDGQVTVGKVLHLSLSADHRVVDGMQGARFLSAVKQSLEVPESFWLL